MLSINTNQNRSNVNFKSHIKENNFFKSGLYFAKDNLKAGADTEKGLDLLRAINGIQNDGKHDFVTFNARQNHIYTSINGKKAEKYTFLSTGNPGLDAHNAIVNYAKQNNAYSKKPLCSSEEKVNNLQKDLEKAKKKMFAELRGQINRIL